MAYELHGLLAGNVSIVTGENIKPSYGGDDEAFLRKVITPIYRVIDKVFCHPIPWICFRLVCMLWWVLITLNNPGSQKERKWNSSSLNLVQLRWSKWVLLVRLDLGSYFIWTISLMVFSLPDFFFINYYILPQVIWLLFSWMAHAWWWWIF